MVALFDDRSDRTAAHAPSAPSPRRWRSDAWRGRWFDPSERGVERGVLAQSPTPRPMTIQPIAQLSQELPLGSQRVQPMSNRYRSSDHRSRTPAPQSLVRSSSSSIRWCRLVRVHHRSAPPRGLDRGQLRAEYVVLGSATHRHWTPRPSHQDISRLTQA